MAYTKNNPNLKKTLDVALSDFRRVMLSMLREEAENMGYSMSYIETLRYIAGNNHPSMKDIAAHLGVTPPSVTTLVEAMIRKGLIVRVPDSSDRRTIHVTLTQNAWKLFRSLEDRKKVIIGKMFSNLTGNEKVQLIAIIERVVAHAQKNPSRKKLPARKK